MRGRKLTREEAIEEYLVYQIRLYEFLHIFQVTLDLMEGKYKPENLLGHTPSDFFGSLRTVSYGLFASLMDRQSKALNIFDVWVVLYPDKEQRIVETWKKIEPDVQLILDYRNHVAFHANRNLRQYFDTRFRFRERRKEIISAMQEFFGLATELMKAQATAIPDFRKEIEPALRKALPQLDEQKLEKFKDYFIQNSMPE